ncbi:hypothetical protein [Streptomyces sp. KL116D]|uniref:hypothetical protein n=1 Tax=Streptomyces sp. KL116D TaxID=3045152 RepID=UPI0035563EBF
MALTYQDVMTADLSFFVDVSTAWKKMGDRFGELQTDYEKNVQGVLGNGNWQGLAYGAQQQNASATALRVRRGEGGGARRREPAHRRAHRSGPAAEGGQGPRRGRGEEGRLQGRLWSGKATYVGFDKMSQDEKFALHHDPDYPKLVADANQRPGLVRRHHQGRPGRATTATRA